MVQEIIERVKNLYYPLEGFKKFNDPSDPLYHLYKDRQLEEAQDKGNNNAIDAVVKILEEYLNLP